MEKDLPFALMNMSVELNIGLPFFKTIKNIAEQDYGVVSIEFEKIVKGVEINGASLQEALFNLSERINSKELKRTISQMINVYETGNKEQPGDSLKKIAEEQLIKQKNALKEFSGKMVVYSLMFIAVSAIIPALFQAFIIIGSSFMKLGIDSTQLLLINLAGFPLIDLGILLYIKSQTPAFLK